MGRTHDGMDSLTAIKMFIGLLYLVGGVLLQPGFYWIIPTGTYTVPPPPPPAPVPAEPLIVPVFDYDNYVKGMNLLIVGVGMVLVAAIVDLVCVHCPAPRNSFNPDDVEKAESLSAGLTRTETHRTEIRAHVGGSVFVRLFGPVCQVLGAAVLLFGCVVLLPKYAGVCSPTCPPLPFPVLLNQTSGECMGNVQPHVWVPITKPVNMCEPRHWLGQKMTDLGQKSFQVASVIYAIGAVFSIYGLIVAIKQAHKEGRSSDGLYATILAFVLFMATSTLFFINGSLATKDCVEAGWLRMAAAICMLVAIVILFAVNGAEAMAKQKASDPLQL